jgi:hypothetical protein
MLLGGEQQMPIIHINIFGFVKQDTDNRAIGFDRHRITTVATLTSIGTQISHTATCEAQTSALSSTDQSVSTGLQISLDVSQPAMQMPFLHRIWVDTVCACPPRLQIVGHGLEPYQSCIMYANSPSNKGEVPGPY